MPWISIFALGVVGALLSTAAAAQTRSGSPYEISSCTANYNYCLEATRRSGGSTAACEAQYQQCMRSGTIPDPYNRRQLPVERR